LLQSTLQSQPSGSGDLASICTFLLEAWRCFLRAHLPQQHCSWTQCVTSPAVVSTECETMLEHACVGRCTGRSTGAATAPTAVQMPAIIRTTCTPAAAQCAATKTRQIAADEACSKLTVRRPLVAPLAPACAAAMHCENAVGGCHTHRATHEEALSKHSHPPECEATAPECPLG